VEHLVSPSLVKVHDFYTVTHDLMTKFII
jgi:hypothetical protein